MPDEQLNNRSARLHDRRLFDSIARNYDRQRPQYPAQLYQDLITLTQLQPGQQVLDIGAGTGQASVPLARKGYTVTALELGPELAHIAREHLQPYGAEVLVGAFEEMVLPAGTFDLVLSATAFHWLDPPVRFRKAADLLKDGGHLAVFASWHDPDDPHPFFAAARPLYADHFHTATTRGTLVPTNEEVLETKLFEQPERRSYRWSMQYTTEEYLELLSTYSYYQKLPAPERDILRTKIAALIGKEFHGSITKQYLTELVVVRRR